MRRTDWYVMGALGVVGLTLVIIAALLVIAK
jgi:hypothetical protein